MIRARAVTTSNLRSVSRAGSRHQRRLGCDKLDVCYDAVKATSGAPMWAWVDEFAAVYVERRSIRARGPLNPRLHNYFDGFYKRRTWHAELGVTITNIGLLAQRLEQCAVRLLPLLAQIIVMQDARLDLCCPHTHAWPTWNGNWCHSIDRCYLGRKCLRNCWPARASWYLNRANGNTLLYTQTGGKIDERQRRFAVGGKMIDGQRRQSGDAGSPI